MWLNQNIVLIVAFFLQKLESCEVIVPVMQWMTSLCWFLHVAQIHRTTMLSNV